VARPAQCNPDGEHGRDPDDADRTGEGWIHVEIGVLDLEGEDPVVIHAMPLRRKFNRFLG
jgi:hypothetical protein